MNALEKSENAIAVPGIDADGVIADGKQPAVFRLDCGDVDVRPALASELKGVFDEAGEDVANPIGISVHHRERIVSHPGIGPVNARLDRGKCTGERRVGVEMAVRPRLANDSHIRRQPGQQPGFPQ